MTDKDKDALKPCPFCGEENVIFSETLTDKIVECLGCGAEAAAALWNNRPGEKS